MRAAYVVGSVGVLLAASSAAAQTQIPLHLQADYEAAAGVYSVVRVNERKLPAESWTRKSPEVVCNTETREGTLLLDSKGRWTAYMTERDRCEFSADLKKSIFPDVSTIATGEYTINGDTLELRDAASGAAYTGMLSHGVLTLSVKGAGSLDGQKAVYTARRMRQVR